MGNTKISSKGQITIPKEIRDKLNLKLGDRIIVEAREQVAIVRPLNIDTDFVNVKQIRIKAPGMEIAD